MMTLSWKLLSVLPANFAAIVLATAAHAETPHVKGNSVVWGDGSYEIINTYSGMCPSDELRFGTNDGLVKVPRFTDMSKVEEFISQQVNSKCGGQDYAHYKCKGSSHMWVSRKAGLYYALYCLGDPVGTESLQNKKGKKRS
jgi:hypothetical protein